MATHRWRRARGALRVVPTVVGCLVLVLLGDLVIGALLGRGDPPAPPPDLLLPGPTDVVASDEVDPRVNAVGMGGVPWSEDYWNQFHSLDYGVVPFLYTFQEDSDLPYIKVRNGIRHSYQQADLPADAPVVWFFGGSAIWGEGNRDLYTIPSQFARVAEGSVDIYPRLGPTSEWDVAAGHAVVTAAGGKVTDSKGAELHFGLGGGDFRVPEFIAWGDPSAAT